MDEYLRPRFKNEGISVFVFTRLTINNSNLHVHNCSVIITSQLFAIQCMITSSHSCFLCNIIYIYIYISFFCSDCETTNHLFYYILNFNYSNHHQIVRESIYSNYHLLRREGESNDECSSKFCRPN